MVKKKKKKKKKMGKNSQFRCWNFGGAMAMAKSKKQAQEGNKRFLLVSCSVFFLLLFTLSINSKNFRAIIWSHYQLCFRHSLLDVVVAAAVVVVSFFPPLFSVSLIGCSKVILLSSHHWAHRITEHKNGKLISLKNFKIKMTDLETQRNMAHTVHSALYICYMQRHPTKTG